MAITLIILGILGLILSFSLVNKKLYAAQLSLNQFNGKTKEHRAGLSWKWFWSKLQAPEVDMRASIIITSGGILLMSWEEFMQKELYKKIAPRIYETNDSILYGSWATAIRCAPGFVQTFLLQTPQVGALMTMSEIDLTISDYLAKQGTEEVLSQKKKVSRLLAKTFGGVNDDISSDHERHYGLIVTNPKLFDLNYGEKSQEAAEKLFVVKKFNDSLKELKDSITDEKSRTDAAYIATGMVKKSINENLNHNVVEIAGLENMIKNVGDNLVTYFTTKPSNP